MHENLRLLLQVLIIISCNLKDSRARCIASAIVWICENACGVHIPIATFWEPEKIVYPYQLHSSCHPLPSLMLLWFGLNAFDYCYCSAHFLSHMIIIFLIFLFTVKNSQLVACWPTTVRSIIFIKSIYCQYSTWHLPLT